MKKREGVYCIIYNMQEINVGWRKKGGNYILP
jgi:hypothetical protein